MVIMMENGQVTVVKHALVQHKLSLMREKETGTRDFRTLVTEIATFLCYEAMCVFWIRCLPPAALRAMPSAP